MREWRPALPTLCYCSSVVGTLRGVDAPLHMVRRRDLISWVFHGWTIEKDCILTQRMKYEDTSEMLDYFVVTVAQILKFSDSTMETKISFFLLFRKFCFHDGTILENCTRTSSPWVSHCIFSFAGMLCFWFMTFVTVDSVVCLRAIEVWFCFDNTCMSPPGSSRESYSSNWRCGLCWWCSKRGTIRSLRIYWTCTCVSRCLWISVLTICPWQSSHKIKWLW